MGTCARGQRSHGVRAAEKQQEVRATHVPSPQRCNRAGRSSADLELEAETIAEQVAKDARLPGSSRATRYPALPRNGAVTRPQAYLSRAVRSLLESPGTGTPLAPAIKRPTEAALGWDLSAVRVHADGPSHTASSELGARAFAHGSHVFLGAGESSHDAHLVAHESAHVVQQALHLGAPAIQRTPLARAS